MVWEQRAHGPHICRTCSKPFRSHAALHLHQHQVRAHPDLACPACRLRCFHRKDFTQRIIFQHPSLNTLHALAVQRHEDETERESEGAAGRIHDKGPTRPFKTFDSPSLVSKYMTRLVDAAHKDIAPSSAKRRERDAWSGIRRPNPLEHWDDIRHLTYRKRRAEEGTITASARGDDTGADELAEAEQASEARGHYEWYAVSRPRSPLKEHCWPDDGKAKVAIGEASYRVDTIQDVVPTMEILYAQQSNSDDESSEGADDVDGNEKICPGEGKWAEHHPDEEDLDVPNEGYEDAEER